MYINYSLFFKIIFRYKIYVHLKGEIIISTGGKMKTLICTLAILIIGVPAHSKSINEKGISYCSGIMPNSFKELNLYFYYTSPKVGSSMLLTLDEGEEIQASYTIVAARAVSYVKTAYELGFQNGFSLGDVVLVQNGPLYDYELIIYRGHRKTVIDLSCE